MHFSFICRHDPVLAAAEVALHVEKEVKAAGKSTMQCSKHPNRVLHAHTVTLLLLSRSYHCMQSSMHSQASKCAFFKLSIPPFTTSIVQACCSAIIAVQVNNMCG